MSLTEVPWMEWANIFFPKTFRIYVTNQDYNIMCSLTYSIKHWDLTIVAKHHDEWKVLQEVKCWFFERRRCYNDSSCFETSWPLVQVNILFTQQSSFKLWELGGRGCLSFKENLPHTMTLQMVKKSWLSIHFSCIYKFAWWFVYVLAERPITPSPVS